MCFCLSVGLDAAGKTTILYKLKLGEIVTTIPTIGELIVVITAVNYVVITLPLTVNIIRVVNYILDILGRKPLRRHVYNVGHLVWFRIITTLYFVMPPGHVKANLQPKII